MTTNAFTRAYGHVANALATGTARRRDRRALAAAPDYVLRDLGIDPDTVRANPPETLPFLMLMQR